MTPALQEQTLLLTKTHLSEMNAADIVAVVQSPAPGEDKFQGRHICVGFGDAGAGGKSVSYWI